jgi:hypothetical protein
MFGTVSSLLLVSTLIMAMCSTVEAGDFTISTMLAGSVYAHVLAVCGIVVALVALVCTVFTRYGTHRGRTRVLFIAITACLSVLALTTICMVRVREHVVVAGLLFMFLLAFMLLVYRDNRAAQPEGGDAAVELGILIWYVLSVSVLFACLGFVYCHAGYKRPMIVGSLAEYNSVLAFIMYVMVAGFLS